MAEKRTILNWRQPTGPADLSWRAVRRLWAAVAIAGFPFLFIIDALYDGSFSPVLPGLIVLILIWVGVPYAHYEAIRQAPTEDRASRYDLRSKYLLGAAVGWLLLWLVFA